MIANPSITPEEIEAMHKMVTQKVKAPPTIWKQMGTWMTGLFTQFRRNKEEEKAQRGQLSTVEFEKQIAAAAHTKAMHRLSCLQGYQAKANLVRQGKGRNSLAGVPAAYREVEG